MKAMTVIDTSLFMLVLGREGTCSLRDKMGIWCDDAKPAN